MVKKAKSAKKPASKKKPADKPKGIKPQALLPKIGIVSSIAVGQALRAQFESAVNANANATIEFVYADLLGYDPAKLKQAITNFNAPASQTGLIVTMGGLVAYRAAHAHSNLGFLSLVGSVPTGQSIHCFGGLSLESFGYNEARVQYLISKGYTSANCISLYCNPKSDMSGQEVAAWQRLRQTYPQLVPQPVLATTNNNTSDYPISAAQISPGAVIVSADPFFQQTKNDLIAALNNQFIARDPANNYVVYPLYNYANPGGTAPTQGRSTLLGPRLDDAVKTMGWMAAFAINNETKLGFIKEPLGTPQDL
jgi:hypothetical protein